jgi:hypothetical protein
MTTFTTEDRIIAEKDGSFTINVEGSVTSSPPHIVDSGASVMNNKPVAWMLTLPDGTHDWILDGNGCEGYIPLYTHPVKELTDEEIMAITEPMFVLGDKKMICDFARAILRKASEK